MGTLLEIVKTLASLPESEEPYEAGRFPYERGIHPSMYYLAQGGQLWTMRQYAGFGDPAQTNQRFHDMLANGQTGLSMAFALPTQLGYDPTHPLALGEVGGVGVSIATLDHMRACFQGINLGEVSTSMTINATAPLLFAMYVAVAQEQGVPLSTLRGTVQNDILKEFVARNLYIFNPKVSLRLFTDLYEYCIQNQMDKWNPVSVSGYHIREAGSTPIQEVAFTLAHAIEYIEQLQHRKISIDQIAPRMSFFFNSHINDYPTNNFYLEVAKFRAARRIWATTIRHHYHAQDPKSEKMRMHVQTAGSSLTASNPDKNILRVAYQALAAVFGGTQSLHTNGKDEALGIPTKESALLALATQQILASETGLPDVADPLGMHPHVRQLTDEIEKGVLDYFRKINERGGTLACIMSGYFQEEIAHEAMRYQRWRDQHPNEIGGTRGAPDLFKMDAHKVETHIQDVKRFISTERDQVQAATALSILEETARGEENLMPGILEAVKKKATVGEIVQCLERPFGGRYTQA